jgi:hypothetical protein
VPQFESENLTSQLRAIGIICRQISVNGASMAAGAVGVGTVAVPGLTPQHRCFVSAANALSGAVAVTGARVATSGTLTVDFANPTAGVLDPAAALFNLFAVPGDI